MVAEAIGFGVDGHGDEAVHADSLAIESFGYVFELESNGTTGVLSRWYSVKLDVHGPRRLALVVCII